MSCLGYYVRIEMAIKVFFVSLIFASVIFAFNGQEGEYYGHYSTAMENRHPTAADAGIPGYISGSTRGICPAGSNDEEPGGNDDPNSLRVNPVFRQWATGYQNYIPAPAASAALIGRESYTYYGGVPKDWRRPEASLGPVTGDNFDVCVLGDLHESQLNVLDPSDPNYADNDILDPNDPYKIQPGQVTVSFDDPLCDGPGPDFAVFENGFISAGGAGIGGQIFAELAYVEVSTDGEMFARFPSVSLTSAKVGAYGTIDPSNVYNLAGKHVNAYERTWGTPFNLKDLANSEAVINGDVDLQNINYIKIVDIPGSGFYEDSAIELIDPNSIDPETGEGGEYFQTNHSVYDAWVTWGSGGFDLEAIGAIEQLYGDANSDGKVNMADFIRLANRWNMYGNWPQGDFDENRFIDINDLYLLATNWLNSVKRD